MSIDPEYKSSFIDGIIKSLDDLITPEEIKIIMVELIKNRLNDRDLEYIADRIDNFYYPRLYKEELELSGIKMKNLKNDLPNAP